LDNNGAVLVFAVLVFEGYMSRVIRMFPLHMSYSCL